MFNSTHHVNLYVEEFNKDNVKRLMNTPDRRVIVINTELEHQVDNEVLEKVRIVNEVAKTGENVQRMSDVKGR